MYFIKPAEGVDSDKFFYVIATSGCTASAVSGDRYYVPEKVIKLLDQNNLPFVYVNDKDKKT